MSCARLLGFAWRLSYLILFSRAILDQALLHILIYALIVAWNLDLCHGILIYVTSYLYDNYDSHCLPLSICHFTTNASVALRVAEGVAFLLDV